MLRSVSCEMTKQIAASDLGAKVTVFQAKSFDLEALLCPLAGQLAILGTHNFEQESSLGMWFYHIGYALELFTKFGKVL